MTDTLILGEPAVLFAVFSRINAKDRKTKIPLNQTTVTLTITLPDGTTTSFVKAAMRNPETGRYEIDYTPTLSTAAGVPYKLVVQGGPTSYTDEFANSRTYTGIQVKTFHVKAATA